ncbi:MAG TPA: zf-HC2 domain-containing protein [Gemmatales bacterium]|nr:zf-HC2 domain-containing protein [Gemmatales bacterium]
MLPIDPAELSAYLDGELTPQRLEEVRDALARDQVLRQTFDQLASNDSAWKAQAKTVMFQPRVQFARRTSFDWYGKAAIIVLGLLLLRLALKTFPPLYAVGFEIILLAAVIGWGLQRIMHATDSDCGRYARIQTS